jgi:hypothetical protein
VTLLLGVQLSDDGFLFVWGSGGPLRQHFATGVTGWVAGADGQLGYEDLSHKLTPTLQDVLEIEGMEVAERLYHAGMQHLASGVLAGVHDGALMLPLGCCDRPGARSGGGSAASVMLCNSLNELSC